MKFIMDALRYSAFKIVVLLIIPLIPMAFVVPEVNRFVKANLGVLGVAVAVIGCLIAAISAHYTAKGIHFTMISNDTPEVVVRVYPSKQSIHLLMLCIENIGTGIAKNIRFKTDIEFKPDGQTSLGELGFIKKGISYLSRGQKIEHFLTSDIGRLEYLKNHPLEITVTYEDRRGEVFPHDDNKFIIDFGEWEGLASINSIPEKIVKNTKAIADELREMRK